jgi:light-regulated signal transduction histidine kinase (bacteriophytochrome)
MARCLLRGIRSNNMRGNTVNSLKILRKSGEERTEQIQPVLQHAGLPGQSHHLNVVPETAGRDSFKELEALSYSISHDLHSPLRVIRNNCELLERKSCLKPGTDEERLVKQIAGSAERMESLLNALLDFSRYVRIKPGCSLINMTDLAADVTGELLKQENNTANISIDIEPLPDVYGDRILLRQVWCNFISNALKFTMYKPHRNIRIESYSSSEEIVYSVCDNGAGFDMKYADKLFSAFSRLHSIEEFTGTGVGLAIVHRIIERHGGSVWAEGEIDTGACFYFSLPKRKGN